MGNATSGNGRRRSSSVRKDHKAIDRSGSPSGSEHHHPASNRLSGAHTQGSAGTADGAIDLTQDDGDENDSENYDDTKLSDEEESIIEGDDSDAERHDDLNGSEHGHEDGEEGDDAPNSNGGDNEEAEEENEVEEEKEGEEGEEEEEEEKEEGEQEDEGEEEEEEEVEELPKGWAHTTSPKTKKMIFPTRAPSPGPITTRKGTRVGEYTVPRSTSKDSQKDQAGISVDPSKTTKKDKSKGSSKQKDPKKSKENSEPPRQTMAEKSKKGKGKEIEQSAKSRSRQPLLKLMAPKPSKLPERADQTTIKRVNGINRQVMYVVLSNLQPPMNEPTGDPTVLVGTIDKRLNRGVFTSLEKARDASKAIQISNIKRIDVDGGEKYITAKGFDGDQVWVKLEAVEVYKRLETTSDDGSRNVAHGRNTRQRSQQDSTNAGEGSSGGAKRTTVHRQRITVADTHEQVANQSQDAQTKEGGSKTLGTTSKKRSSAEAGLDKRSAEETTTADDSEPKHKKARRVTIEEDGKTLIQEYDPEGRLRYEQKDTNDEKVTTDFDSDEDGGTTTGENQTKVLRPRFSGTWATMTKEV